MYQLHSHHSESRFDYSSYFYNASFPNIPTNNTTSDPLPGVGNRKLSSIKEPSKTILVAEAPAFILIHGMTLKSLHLTDWLHLTMRKTPLVLWMGMSVIPKCIGTAARLKKLWATLFRNGRLLIIRPTVITTSGVRIKPSAVFLRFFRFFDRKSRFMCGWRE